MPELNELNVMWVWMFLLGVAMLFVAVIAMRAEEKAEKASRRPIRNKDAEYVNESIEKLVNLGESATDAISTIEKMWDAQLKENKKLEGEIKSLDAMVLAVKEGTEKELERLRAEGLEDCACRQKSLGGRNASEVHGDGPTWKL